MKQHRYWYLFFLLSAAAPACKKDGTAIPFINSVSPLKGAYNTEVSIRGRYFSQSGNIVKFNNLTAEIISSSDTLLKVKVPKGAETGDILVTTGGMDVKGPEFQYDYTVTVSTVAGNGTASYTEGNGTAAGLKAPGQMVFDKDDNLYFIDQDGAAIRKMSPTGDVTNYAGGSSKAEPTDGTGSAAHFGYLRDICTDRNTNTLYAVDYSINFSAGNRISRIIPEGNAGKVTAVYPGGPGGYADNTNIPSARFSQVQACVTDNNGNLYVAENGSYCIRKINFTGTGVSTLAGKAGSYGYADGQGPEAIFKGMIDIIMDGGNNLLVSDVNNHRIRKITTSGLVNTLAGNGYIPETDGHLPAGIISPRFEAMDKKGNLYVSNGTGTRMRMITSAGRIVTIIQGGVYGYQDGNAADAKFNVIAGIAVDSKNRIYVSDIGNNRIRRIIVE